MRFVVYRVPLGQVSFRVEFRSFALSRPFNQCTILILIIRYSYEKDKRAKLGNLQK